MRKTLIRNILLLSVIVSVGACKKQLELFPYGSISLQQSFETVKDGTDWDNGFYTSLRNNVYGGTWLVPQEVAGDQLNATLDYGNNYGNPHRWGQSFNSDDGVLSGTWAGAYGVIRNLDLCIQNFSNITTTSQSDKDLMNKYLGDAYFARAYFYSELAIRFCKPYEPSSATTDLGLPLVLTYDVNALPARATLAETYTQILSDITQAKTLLASYPGSQSATKFNIDVVNALEARVRLNMQDWSGAMTASNTLISSNKYPLITTQAALSAMWTNDISTEVIFQSSVTKTSETPQTNNIFIQYSTSAGANDPFFLPTKAIVDFYDASDIRKGVYFAQLPVKIQNISYSLYLVNKFPGNPALFTSSLSNYQNAPKVFRVAEQYLIYAEAAARTGSNDAQALSALNTLRTARGTTTLTGLTGTALLQAVKDERTRELAFEGFHLWDLKRWHQGFTRGTPQNLGPINQGANYNLLTIAADNNQFVWGIPTNDIVINKNLVQNPGW